MPTFLEVLWSNLYAADCERRFAAFAASGLEVADLSAAQRADIGAKAAAFADAMVQATPGAGLAALQAAIAALKP